MMSEDGDYQRVVICHNGEPIIITVFQTEDEWVAEYAWGGWEQWFGRSDTRAGAIDVLRGMLPEQFPA